MASYLFGDSISTPAYPSLHSNSQTDSAGRPRAGARSAVVQAVPDDGLDVGVAVAGSDGIASVAAAASLGAADSESEEEHPTKRNKAATRPRTYTPFPWCCSLCEYIKLSGQLSVEVRI